MNDLTDKSDDALVARIRSSIRAEERFYWSLLIMLLAWSAIFAGVLQLHIPLQTGGFAALAVLIAWLVAAFVSRSGNTIAPARADYSEDILRRTIDDQQRRWRWFYAFVFVFVGGFAVATSLALLRTDRTGHILALTWAPDLIMAAAFAAFQVCFGPSFLTRAYRRALNDELTRAMQRSAAMFGYLFSVIALGVLLVASLIRPQWGVAAMPGALAAAVILPGLYFLFLRWRAGGDG